jgi:hypothetical protein
MTDEPAHVFRAAFPQLSAASANRAAEELQEAIEDRSGGALRPEIVKDRDDTHDLGSILQIVLTAPAMVIPANAVFQFRKKRGERVEITTRRGKLVVSGPATANLDVAAIVAAVQSAVDG